MSEVSRAFAARAGRVTRTAARRGARAATRRIVPPPVVRAIPQGRLLDLPGRGCTYVLDIPGPTETAPTVVLLHALGCTAALSWGAAFERLSARYRVVTFDLRWHGRGIRSRRFRFADNADDVAAVLTELGVDRAIVVGYSMGGAIAQLTWQRHRDRVAGLVLCSTARNFRGKTRERMFFGALSAAMYPLSRYALARVERLAATLPHTPEALEPELWGRAEFRSTSAWSMPEVLGELGRFSSASWIGAVDVPTSVVVTARDRAVPSRRQYRLGAAIPGAAVFVAPGGHASIVLDAKNWVPVLADAIDSVANRLETSQEAVG
jgi:pimeloyl-ACP methyl ester carboxylesterase